MKKETCKGGKTTNYEADTHKKFCKRCYEYNKRCPDTKSYKISKTCDI